MSFKALVTAFFLLFASCAVVMPDTAEAARMGGGRSFGSRPAMRTPAAPPATNMQRQAQPNATQRQNAVGQPSRGFLGGMGGIFGGLLAGTLLGSLLSGGGFSGGGILDILLLGVLVYLGYRFLVRRRANSTAPSPAPAAAAGAHGGMMQAPIPQSNYTSQYAETPAENGTAQSAWGSLNNGTAPQPSGPQVPPGFDIDEFLEGAKLAYTRLQASWDKRDLNDIAQFTTPPVMEALREQLAQEPSSGRTEIILVNAQLLEVNEEGTEERAQVYFDVLLREDPQQSTPTNAREIWHFVRERSNNGMWKLDGIQQISA